MSSEFISVQTADGICSIGFARPEKKNAITAAMYQSLADALTSGASSSEVRVFLIHGSPECFTAGNDLLDFMMKPPSGPDAPVFQFLQAISTASKPIVAAVAGTCVGVGTTLLMHCDLVYAADNAKFSMPFAKLGLCPEAASSFLLPAISGYHRAAEALLLGDVFSAEEGREMGLVNRVLAPEQVLEFATAQASKLAQLPASSIRTTKQLLKSGQATVIAQRMQEEGIHFQAMLKSPEAKEAFSAFMAKRTPNFQQFS
jgi:enoyl-CoA hydratase/carnithine racemase